MMIIEKKVGQIVAIEVVIKNEDKIKMRKMK